MCKNSKVLLNHSTKQFNICILAQTKTKDMKKALFTAIIVFFFNSCGNKVKETNSETTLEEVAQVKEYPTAISYIFEAHGGITTWNKMNNLCFEIEKPSGAEMHSTDLKSRKTLIASNAFNIGNDGEKIWIEEIDKPYEGNPKFYYNLMFYFYAMPFILADDGIVYTDLEDTILEDKTYGAIKIGYNAGVGETPEDEYIVFYDKETHKMAWLAYTITFFDKTKSTDWHYIKYDTWLTENGLLLPQTLVWFDVKEGKPSTPKNTVAFSKVLVSESVLENSTFQAPDGSRVVE
ncbi:MAG: hypothetical protein CVU03_04730 [Bacteroidetes bacterium HGW-Bacteroidetes-2]|nr:MAG: hypothetical protein CVU03_04730 [Bacteroidetes bacterium HGW-Bacteroidetes-2]